jgi:hypothetical protein
MLIRQAGRAGADILLVPSSDWEAIAEMHRRMAVFRGVENGVNLVPPPGRAPRWPATIRAGCWATRATTFVPSR